MVNGYLASSSIQGGVAQQHHHLHAQLLCAKNPVTCFTLLSTPHFAAHVIKWQIRFSTDPHCQAQTSHDMKMMPGIINNTHARLLLPFNATIHSFSSVTLLSISPWSISSSSPMVITCNIKKSRSNTNAKENFGHLQVRNHVPALSPFPLSYQSRPSGILLGTKNFHNFLSQQWDPTIA